jgi:hypothetical protein
MNKKFSNLFLVLAVGMVLTGFFSFSFPVLASNDVYGNITTATAGTGLSESGDILPIISALISLVLSFLGIVLVVMIIWAGIMWMTAGGEKTNVQKAKDMIKNGVIGLLIVLASYAITSFVISSLDKSAFRSKATPLEQSEPTD